MSTTRRNPNDDQRAADSTPARDQQWLQEMCELVKNKTPDTHTFVVFAFPISTTDRCYYASNAERPGAVAALKEWLSHQEKLDNWMKHDAGTPKQDTSPPNFH